MDKLTYSSPVLGFLVTLGNLAIWFGLAFAIGAVALYWTSMLRSLRGLKPGVEAVDEAPAAASVSANGNGRNGKHGHGKEARHARSSVSAAEQKTERAAIWGRRFYLLTSAATLTAAACMWALIFRQEYAVHYIWKNTQTHLLFGYRFAAFWSDQEGSFLLWALYNVLLGGLLLWKARAEERWVMPFFALINVSLYLLMTFMNPFWMHDAKEVREQLMAPRIGADPSMLTFLPTAASSLAHKLSYYFGWGHYLKMQDGRGLNESLQNFWMVIHPPTLFLGYSSMMIPSCFALAALMRRNYDGWVQRAAPWLTFAWAVLGTGIFLGGYWAYETLGWGGYWAWDPSENSPLMPWLAGTALVHGLMAQRNRGNFKHANLFLGALVGNLVLLGSFLVRSGVLTGSVHSFATPQASVFNTLLGVMAVWFVMSIGIWLWRFKDIQSEIAYEEVWERHFGFFLGLIVLSASAIVVAFGVTLPIWKPWLHLGTSSLDHTFYNKALLPVAFVTVLLMALTPLMPWRKVRERPLDWLDKVTLALIAPITLFFLAAGAWAWKGGFRTSPSYINDPVYLGFGMMLALALVINLIHLARTARTGFLNTGPWVAHVGFLVLMVGIMITTRYKVTRMVTKAEIDQPIRVLGRDFIFRGQEKAKSPVDRDRLVIDVQTPHGNRTARPKLFVSTITNEPMAWPEIWHEGLNDLYITPNGVDNSGDAAVQDVKQGEPAELLVQHRAGDPEDRVFLTLEGVDLADMRKNLSAGKPFRVVALVTLNINGVDKKVRAVGVADPGHNDEHAHQSGPMMGMFEHLQPIAVPVTGLSQPTGYSLVLTSLMPVPGAVTANFALRPNEPVQQAYFQIMWIPGIQVVWWGAYIMFFGGFMCYRRRALLARRPVPAAEPAVGERQPGRQSVPAPAGAE